MEKEEKGGKTSWKTKELVLEIGLEKGMGGRGGRILLICSTLFNYGRRRKTLVT